MRREDALQKAVARLLDTLGLTWQHSPNEGLRTQRQGAHAKAMGLKPGWPDIMIYNTPDARGWYKCGLAIELKAPDAKGKRPKPRPNQLEWHDRLRMCGWRVEVCYTMDEVLAVLRECYPARFHGQGMVPEEPRPR